MILDITSYADLASIFPGVGTISQLEEAGEIEFRKYQVLAALMFNRYRRGTIRLATGAGKTLLMATAIGMLDVKTLVVLYGSVLIEQTRKELERFLGEPIGLIEADTMDVQRVTVASVPTLAKRFKDRKKASAMFEAVGDTQFLVFDEVHHASADSWRKVASKIKAPYRLGLSGTPMKGVSLDDAQLVSVCGPLIVDFGVSVMQKLGYISTARIVLVEQDYSDIGRKLAKERWNVVRDEMIVNNKHRTETIAKDIEEYAARNPDAKILVMTGESRELALNLHVMLSKHPWVGLAHGQIKRGEVGEVFQKLKRGELRCVIATKLADEGIDIPGVNAVFLVGGGKSYVKTIQRIGRGLRLTSSTEPLTVVDYLACGHRYLDSHAKERRNVYAEEEMFVDTEVKTGSLFGETQL